MCLCVCVGLGGGDQGGERAVEYVIPPDKGAVYWRRMTYLMEAYPGGRDFKGAVSPLFTAP